MNYKSVDDTNKIPTNYSGLMEYMEYERIQYWRLDCGYLTKEVTKEEFDNMLAYRNSTLGKLIWK